MNYIRGNSQTKYKNGSMMCTSACLVMGIATASGKVDLSDIQVSGKEVLDMAMELGSRAQGKIESSVKINQCTKRSIGGIPFSVRDILLGLDIDTESIGINIHEYVVCNGINRRNDGFKNGVDDEPCLINCDDLIDCIANIGNRSSSSCILTYNGHSTCISHNRGVFSFFDPAPSVLVNGMSRNDADRMIESIKLDIKNDNELQCDATVIYI